MSTSLQLTVALTPRGYRGVLLHLSAKRLRLIVPMLAFFGFAALGGGFNAQAFGLLAALAAVLITVWGYISWNVSSPRSTPLYVPVAYEFSDEGIVMADEDGASSLEWTSVRRWAFAAGHYLLYVAGASYLLLPVEGVSGDDTDRLETLLRTHVRKGPRALR